MTGPVVGRGRASSVVDNGDGSVLRIGGHPATEAAIMTTALAHGFPVPRVLAVRDEGLVLERIDGPTMGQHLARHPWLMRREAGVLADLHHRLHEISLDDQALVHLDLHPNNVLLSSRGPVVIDWTNARGGDPDADVAMTWLILETSAGFAGRVMAWCFARAAGTAAIARGLDQARRFRLADPNVTDGERYRARRSTVRTRDA